MRIGFDARAIRYRKGIGTYSRNLLRQFAEAGIEVVVFCQDDEKHTIPPADSFTLVSANMDPLAPHGRGAFQALVKAVQGRPAARSQSLGAHPDPRAPGLDHARRHPVPLPAQRARCPYACATNDNCTKTLEESRRVITVSQILFSTLSIYAQRRSGQGQGHPQRGLRTLRAADRRGGAAGRAAPLLAAGALRLLGRRLPAGEERSVPHPGLVEAAEAAGRPARPGAWPGRRRSSTGSCARRWRKQGAGGQGALPRVHRRRRPARRSTRRRPSSCSPRWPRDSDCLLSRPWPAARRASCRTRRRSPRSPARRPCSSTPRRSTASRIA